MKPFFTAWIAAVLAAAGWAHAQEDSVMTKSRWFTQTSSATPAPSASQPFRFTYFGSGLNIGGGSPTLTLPSGTIKPLTTSGSDINYADSAASAAALDQVYGTGTYTFTLPLFGVSLSGRTVFGADAFPDIPQVSNYAAAQTIDPDQEFILKVAPFTAARNDDYMSIVIRDSFGNDVYSDNFHDNSTTDIAIGPQTLGLGNIYTGELSFNRLAARQSADSTLQLAAIFSSVTTFTLVATGNQTVDTTPPLLTQAYPTNGGAILVPQSAILFQFNEAMDVTRQALSLTATQNGVPATLSPDKLTFMWSADNTTFICNYALTSGGWPKGLSIHWTLNANLGAANAMRDQSGNLLGTVSGQFYTTGATQTGCDSTDPTESSSFGFLKLANHLQTGAGVAGNDPTNAAFLSAFNRIPDSPGRAALEFPADPAPKPHQLKFFGANLAGEFLIVPFNSQAELDAAYPAGQYDFQLRDKVAPITVLEHVVLNLTADPYPLAPHFANYAAAQGIDTNTDFSLNWDAFAGATANNAGISLTVEDDQGKTVLSLPDSCDNKPLAVTDTHAVIPKGLLAAGKTYVATLSFLHLNDSGKLMPGTSSKGIAAVGQSTRMTLKAGGGLVATAPLFRSFSIDASGNFVISVECTTGIPLHLEGTAALGTAFNVPLLTTNPPVSPLTITLPATSGPIGFLRARSE